MPESNPVPFMVLGDGEESTRSGFELRVWALADPTVLVNVVPRHKSTSILEELNRRGGGGFMIRVGDQAILDAPTLLDEGNLVEVILDGLRVGWWYIDTVDKEAISQGEYAGEWYTVAGPGIFQILDHARLYPLNGFRKNAATRRYFNFATPAGAWYNAADWDDAVVVTGNWSGYPVLATEENEDGWPVTSSWIWDRNDSVMPEGTCYFRRTFTLAEDTDITMWMTSDDNAWVYIDGELISTVTEYLSWKKAYVTDLRLLAGDHVLGVKVNNYSGTGPAGLNLALIKVVDDDEDTPITNADRIVWTGDGNWKVNSYPSGPPGYSAGLIMRLLYDEAIDRGVDGFGAFTLNFDDDVDSDGMPWGENLDWAWDVGTSYLEIMDEMTATIVDAWMDTDRRLNMLPHRGTDKSIQNAGEQPVIFARTLNVTEAKIAGSSEIRNVVLALNDEGFMEVQGPAESVTKYGRREMFLSLTQANELSVAPVLIQQVFDKFAFPRKSPSISILSVDEHKPWVRALVGDWVKAPDNDDPGQLVKRRVVSLAAQLQDDGTIAYAAELDSIEETRDELVDRWMNAAAKGAGRGAIEGTNTGGATKSASGSGSGGAGTQTSSTGRPGPRGEQGPAGLVWQGAWSIAVAYDLDDAVEYDGSSWIAVEPNIASTPSLVSDDWELLAAKGDDGEPGDPGADGPVYLGVWSSATTYPANSIVSHDGVTWVTAVSSLNHEPGVHADWQRYGVTLARQTITLTGVNGNGTVTMSQGFSIINVTSSGPSRLRLYRSSADRTADAGRDDSTPAPIQGIVLGEFLWPLAGTTYWTTGYTARLDPGASTVYYRVDGGPVDITIVWIGAE